MLGVYGLQHVLFAFAVIELTSTLFFLKTMSYVRRIAYGIQTHLVINEISKINLITFKYFPQHNKWIHKTILTLVNAFAPLLNRPLHWDIAKMHYRRSLYASPVDAVRLWR